jgi:hypothetical protein
MSEENKLEVKLVDIEAKVDRLLRVIIGDDEVAQIGLAKKVDAHEKWIQEKKISDAKLIAASSVISGIGVFLLNLWLSIFTKQ